MLTGLATAVSPVTIELPSGLAGTPSGELFGFASGFADGSPFGQLVQVDPVSGDSTNIGSDNGLRSTAFDITADHRGFILPFDADFETQQLHVLDLSTGTATSIGSATAIGDAIDLARGTPLGSAEPYVLSLGSVGPMLYGVDTDTDSLVSIDSTTGAVGVVGTIGAVGMANGGGYSGFSALTGVDEDLDGEFDALFGSVNQFLGDNGAQRLGGIARLHLTTGEWSLVGTNPEIVFYGFGGTPAPTGCDPADFDCNGAVDSNDLTVILAAWGTCAGCAADLDGDGFVDFEDLMILLASWS